MAKATNPANFEQAMQELEAILEKMSGDELGIDESVELYAKAAALIKQCTEKLNAAQVRVDEITNELTELEDMT